MTQHPKILKPGTGRGFYGSGFAGLGSWEVEVEAGWYRPSRLSKVAASVSVPFGTLLEIRKSSTSQLSKAWYRYSPGAV